MASAVNHTHTHLPFPTQWNSSEAPCCWSKDSNSYLGYESWTSDPCQPLPCFFCSVPATVVCESALLPLTWGPLHVVFPLLRVLISLPSDLENPSFKSAPQGSLHIPHSWDQFLRISSWKFRACTDVMRINLWINVWIMVKICLSHRLQAHQSRDHVHVYIHYV